MMMQSETDQLPSKPNWRSRRLPSGGWFFVLLLICVAGSLYVLLWHGIPLFKWVAENLPLLLPLVVTVLSIFTRAADIRDYESVLKIANDIAIGIISFDIWAISASRSDPSWTILVNPKTMINGDFVLPLLLSGLFMAVGCVVLTQYRFQENRTKQRWLLVGLIASIVVYVAPFGLVEPVAHLQAKPNPNVHRYTVVIPYQDPGIMRVAPTFLRERYFAQFERNIEAINQTDARDNALKRFLSSSDSDQFKNKRGEKVRVYDGGILLVEQ
jgi:hypothetical protein